MSILADAALVHARCGWPVFPLRPPGNEPLTAHGFHDASTNVDTVTAWWSRWPKANIGARTGVLFDVFDVDHPDLAEGVADLPELDMPQGPVARSGGGKWHLYFKPSGLGRRIRFSEHCDWLGTDGYVVLPPSTHRSGGTYTWFAATEHLDLTDAPTVLLEAVRTRNGRDLPENRPLRGALSDATDPAGTKCADDRHPRGWSPAGLLRLMETAAVGSRNATLFWCAHRVVDDLRAGRVPPHVADEALEQLEHTARAQGLTASEVTATIRSALRGTA